MRQPTADEDNDLSDAVLAARVAQRDVAAFSLLYDRYAQAVYALAAHLVGRAEAEEIVQVVFLRLWDRAHQFDPARGAFAAWFMAITRHHVLDEARRLGHQRRLAAIAEIDDLLAEVCDPNVDVEEQVWHSQAGAAVRRALANLPDEQRRVLVLAYFGDLSQSAIARRLGVPLGTVKKRIRLGLGKLRAALTAQGFDADEPAPSARHRAE